MIKTHTDAAPLFTTLGLVLLGLLFFMPQSASAAEETARLGGGNALARATSGQSQGLVHANPASGLLVRLTFAATHGGKPDTAPTDENSNTGGNEASGTNGSQGSNASNQSSGGNSGNPSTGSGQANGGASAGNGGNGGPGTAASQSSAGYGAGDGGNGGGAAPGGLVRAGDVVSNSTALNVLNLNIVRISSR